MCCSAYLTIERAVNLGDRDCHLNPDVISMKCVLAEHVLYQWKNFDITARVSIASRALLELCHGGGDYSMIGDNVTDISLSVNSFLLELVSPRFE